MLHSPPIARTFARKNRLPIALASVVVLSCLFQMGCVSRRATIASNPPGALVLVDGEEVGYTPLAFDFTYYGTREITLVKDGYETLTVMQKVPAPWYQQPGLDFFSDNFLFGHVTDRHHFAYQMQPRMPVSTQELLNRANAIRSETRLSP